MILDSDLIRCLCFYLRNGVMLFILWGGCKGVGGGFGDVIIGIAYSRVGFSDIYVFSCRVFRGIRI